MNKSPKDKMEDNRKEYLEMLDKKQKPRYEPGVSPVYNDPPDLLGVNGDYFPHVSTQYKLKCPKCQDWYEDFYLCGRCLEKLCEKCFDAMDEDDDIRCQSCGYS